jgi:hypothetical protein
MGRKRGRDCSFIARFEQEKAKNTSERRGGEKGVMSGIFDGLPCCMANKAGTDRPSSYRSSLACARQRKEKKEERLGLITHISRPVTAIPPRDLSVD